ncbi:MAG: glycosyltransferase family 1 protein [Burkholderiaceae bacterium]|nr:glycosyltransferase family 1 protein [Burkholderiaceae bacterium]
MITMRVAIVTESFLPSVNGVTNSVIQAHKSLVAEGYEVVIIAPTVGDTPSFYDGSTVVGLPSINFNNSLPVAFPHRLIQQTLDEFAPDIVHLASPAMMGAYAQSISNRRRIPTIAVYQTDYVGFSQHYRLGFAAHGINAAVRKIHGNSTLNLAPSTYAMDILTNLGIRNVARWGRGVDLELFNPERRVDNFFSTSKKVIGYVGRLAPEKGVDKLVPLSFNSDFQIVIVGDGPERSRLQELMPNAIFTGKLSGTELAQHIANFDCFVHPGEHETFCQSAQEALASGVPVIAPDRGAVKEFVIDGENGIVVNMTTSDSLINMSEARWNLLFSSQIKSRARNSVIDRGWDNINQELIGHYFDVLANNRYSIRIGA